MKKILSTILLFLLACVCLAQDPQLTQFYNNPIYLNPSNTGGTKNGRLIFNYRTQWPGITNLTTSLFSFDYFVPLPDHHTAIGVGVLFMDDQAGQNLKLQRTSAQVAVSIEKLMWGNWRIKGGFQFGYLSRKIASDGENLTFEDQLIFGTTNSQDLIQGSSGESKQSPDVSIGTLIGSPNFWIGFAAHHLNTPDQSLISSGFSGDVQPLPVKWTLHTGFEYRLPNKGSKPLSAIRMEGMYMKQGNNEQFITGMNYLIGFNRSKKIGKRFMDHAHHSAADISFSFGLWFRAIPLFTKHDQVKISADAISGQIGFETELIAGFSIGANYSYDFNISSLDLAQAHEVSLTVRTKQFFKILNRNCKKPLTWSERHQHPFNRSNL
ncbi:PorP/SprF family type IX secretion system membrane protein [Fulvivirgaceae bacterium BMA10]|uniref:PorP/SprF family type IX secretion system membrane protein n=1 Tax=Splendidivirga corallicola TaxID=3051826 RepID=A0ABT8KKV5_9BACT|nr:PorP/SprF family type IX secretion system membrane protein [Fulvivirgaceae bacterium BMA10]